MRRLLARLLAAVLAFAPALAPAQTLLLLGAGPGARSSGGGGFSFTDRPAAITSTLFTSNNVTGPGGSTSITGSGCEYQTNGGSWGSGATTTSNGDTLAVRGTSSASVNTALNCALTVGASSDTYTITTLVNSEADSFVKRITTDPGATRDGLIDTVFTGLKSGPINATNNLSTLDGLYMQAAADTQSALLNWVQNAYNLTVGGTVTPVTDRGYTSNGTTGYLDSNFDPSTASSPNFVQNSASAFAYINTNITNGTAYDIGGTTPTVNVTVRLNARSTTANTMRGWITSVSTLSNFGSNTTSIGFFGINRSGATAIQGDYNGSQVGTDTTASNISTANKITFLGSPGDSIFSGRQMASSGFGASRTANQWADLNSVVTTYLTAIGAN